jgi:DNA-binding NarL/FixJ family response regulator
MLTMHDSKDIFCAAIEAGAHGYVLKSDLDEKLIEAVEALCENRAFFSPNISTTATGAPAIIDGEDAAAGGEAGSDILTLRQLEVLKMLAMGKSNKEVASALGISTRTAETHRYQIMNRLRIRTLSELVVYAIRHHVVEV